MVHIIQPAESKIVDASGRPIELEGVRLADRLIKAKQKYQLSDANPSKSFWKVIDEVMEVWKLTRPDEWRATLINIDADRSSAHNEWGVAPSTQGTGELRRMLDVPEFFEKAVRMLYSPEELPFNKEWYTELWKRYPAFRISQKS